MVADVTGMQNMISQIPDETISSLRNHLKIKGVMILFVGQLIPRKGVRELLNAWETFKQSNNEDCTLVYVGSGSQEQELKDIIKSQQIPDVILTGAIDYDHIAPYYKAADCFIIPTLEDNWSLVVPEAMACGLPIATSIYNGCHPELVHQENG